MIKFGTDGWRAVIADGYTFENLARVARATAQWLHAEKGERPSVVIGHDTRFMGADFARHAACVLAAEGVHVTIARGFVPTPAISWATKEYRADAGVVITASHNPPAYNGYKLKASFGGPALPPMVAAVEAELNRLGEAPPLHAFEHYVDAGLIETQDVGAAYVAMLEEKIDVAALRAAGLTVAHDAMYGAGQGFLAAVLGADRVVPLRSEFNPGFHGQAPEPIERNLSELPRVVVAEGCAAGIAHDGDADRIGLFDEGGGYVTSHQILALLGKYLYEEHGLRGALVKTFSTSHLLDAMGKAYGLPVETLPIGFKYIAPHLVSGAALVGGEESGGIAVQGHLPERDGLYVGLLILEMMVRRGKPLSALVEELHDEFGPHYYHREDVHTTPEQKASILDRLRGGGLDHIAGHAVHALETLDGFKHRTKAGWLLVRPSGTEPVLRIYAEAPTPEAARRLVHDALGQLGLDVPASA